VGRRTSIWQRTFKVERARLFAPTFACLFRGRLCSALVRHSVAHSFRHAATTPPACACPGGAFFLAFKKMAF